MPNSIRGATSVGVMPQTLCRAFSETLVWAAAASEYHDGSVQRAALVDVPRRSWVLGIRLTPVQLVTLRNWWETHTADAFYFYNPMEGTPVGSNYDPDGNSTTGRYTVVFRGGWAVEITLGRVNVPQIELVEVA